MFSSFMPAEKGARFGYWRDIVFLGGLGLYVTNRLLIKPNMPHHVPLFLFFHGHLNDCLTVPVALPIYLMVYRWIGLRPDDEPPRWWEVALHAAVWIVFFKRFGPWVLHHGTYDPIDDWCIAGGGLAAWALWQRASFMRVKPA
jgi:hypothetical protein